MGNVEETRAIHMILMDEKGIKIQATIQDLESRSIFVTLWGTYADKMAKYLLKKEDGILVVMILQFGRFKFFKAVLTFQPHTMLQLCLSMMKLMRSLISRISLLLDKEEEKQTFECNNDKCTAPVISAVPRFIIPLRVQDGTGVLSLTLFDMEANKKFNKSAYELLQNTLEGHNKKDYPDVFDDLLEQKMAFKIDITNYNLQCMNTANRSYTISRMTDDSTIISTLEKKHRIEDASQSYSISGRSDNDTSQETVNLKVYDLDESPAQSSTKPRKNVMEAPKVDGNPKLLIPKLEK
ncbi:hypothetical protein L1987_63988 [Smallanthus sonchifolius]|uniref:Uncharacterized protein n=1 Tax=Smallanthus sonchifolius TaxID=185202 RepID=A0ACB9CEW3_9ASTR|nr:hypothetical protein L1987_63988 [Smallanthus sonchifolius]